jgi:hypothetical protein
MKLFHFVWNTSNNGNILQNYRLKIDYAIYITSQFQKTQVKKM